jgi:hypothetical protein
VHPSTLSYHICFGNVHLLRWGRGGRPSEVHGDELVEVGGQDGSLSSCLNFTVSVDPPEAIKFFKLSFNIVNSDLIDVSIAHNLFHGTPDAKSADYHGSYSFLLIHLW